MVDVAKYPKSESVQRLERGEITLDEYLDERTEEALTAYRGKVPESTLDKPSVRLA